jgi:hypothetical protein
MKKRFLLIVLTCLLVSNIAYSEVLIKIEHITSGSTPNDIYLTIRNLGDEPIKGLLIYVDGELKQNYTGYLSPGRAIKSYLSLSFGSHLINVTTPEGATDSINIKISKALEKTTTTTTTLHSQEIPIPFHNVLMFMIILSILSVLSVIVILWFIVRKPKKVKGRKR